MEVTGKVRTIYVKGMWDSVNPATRQDIKEQVERFRSVGQSEEAIIYWIENDLDREVTIVSYFDTIKELAELVNIPVTKFNNAWV